MEEIATMMKGPFAQLLMKSFYQINKLFGKIIDEGIKIALKLLSSLVSPLGELESEDICKYVSFVDTLSVGDILDKDIIVELASILISHEKLERTMGIYQEFFDEANFKYPQISKNERLVRATKKAAKKCISDNMHKELIKFIIFSDIIIGGNNLIDEEYYVNSIIAGQYILDTSLCVFCNKFVEKKYKCAKCLSVIYCNRECQKAHWKIHKTKCI